MQLWGSMFWPSSGTARAFKNTMGTVTAHEQLSVPLESCGWPHITNGNLLQAVITGMILLSAILPHVSDYGWRLQSTPHNTIRCIQDTEFFMHSNNVCVLISSASSIIREHVCYVQMSVKIIDHKWKIWIVFSSGYHVPHINHCCFDTLNRFGNWIFGILLKKNKKQTCYAFLWLELPKAIKFEDFLRRNLSNFPITKKELLKTRINKVCQCLAGWTRRTVKDSFLLWATQQLS